MVSFQYLFPGFRVRDAGLTKDWIIQAAKAEGKKIERIHYVFMSDAQLLVYNQNYLDHDDYTDIITFPYQVDPIEADLLISIERIRENAKSYQSSIIAELRRVMIHGVLHLCGYGDKSESEQIQMRKLENHYLELFDKVSR